MTFKKKADAKYVSSFLDNFTIFISLARESKNPDAGNDLD